MDAHDDRPLFERPLTRRALLRYGAAGVGGLSLAGLLAACGGGGETTAPATTEAEAPPPVTTTEEPPAATESTPVETAPVGGGSLKMVLGDGQSADSLDPALQFTSIGLTTGGMVYDNLLYTDNDWNLTPALAEDYDVTPDAMQYTFKIRQGVEFHTGKTLDANDVAAQFKRVLDEATGSGGLSLLGGVLDASGIEVPDPTTITFKLKAPDGFFGVRCAHYYTRVPAADTSDWLGVSSGTGPFKSVTFTPGVGAQLVRNENYWQDGAPFLDEVEIANVPEQATRVEAVLSGDADLIDPPPLSAVEQFDGSDTAALISVSSSPFTFDIDSSIKPYSDPRVSQAMKMMLDREKMVQFVVRGTGVASADSLIDPRDAFYPADLQPYPYDPEQAKALLAEAGYPDGFKDNIWTTKAYPYLDEGAAFGKQSWDAGGLDMTIQSVSNDRYLKAFLTEPILMDYYLRQHPVLTFDLYYASGPQNTTRLKDGQIDAWIAELKKTVDTAKQKELAGEIIKRYNEVAAEIVPFHFDSLWGHKNRVQNLVLHPMSVFDFAKMQVA